MQHLMLHHSQALADCLWPCAVRTTLKLTSIVAGSFTFNPSIKAAYLAALRAKLPREAGWQGGSGGWLPRVDTANRLLHACPATLWFACPPALGGFARPRAVPQPVSTPRL